ncbi:MAG: CoA transferase [Acidimicrobiales bacterium]
MVGIAPSSPSAPLLDGIVVVDLTQYLAGPTCTRMLMELGADVIKVEAAPYGDPARSFSPRVNRRSGFFIQQNRGKRSICLDLSSVEGKEIIAELAMKADVLVENFSPGVMDRKGLGYEVLAAGNPRLVMASLSGFGQEGPLASKPAFDFIAQAYSGLMHMTGETDGPPLVVGSGIADVNVGVHAFGAIGHALFRRERTGVGAHVDVAMVDALVHMHETAIYAPSLDPTFRPVRQGRFYQPAQPAGVYKGPEGWIVIFCTQGQVDALWRAMEQPELGTDPRFATNSGRLAHREDLATLIERWMEQFERDDEVIKLLELHRVPCSRVKDPAELGDDDHLRQRDAIRTVSDPLVGSLVTPGFPIHFGAGAPPARGASGDVLAPNLGQHNREVVSGMLGWNADRIDELERRGVLVAKDR